MVRKQTEDSNKPVLHPECRHFIGDRPCRFHKESGVKCADCGHFERAAPRVLIVKLGAMGDVLRTTSILPSLTTVYGHPHVSWLTSPESLPLLAGNPQIDSLLAVGPLGLARIQTEFFDLVINPEASRDSAALATLAKATRKLGFGLTAGGWVEPLNAGAEEIFLMGLFDDIKKRNGKTHEQLLCQLAELPCRRSRPILCLADPERSFAREFARRMNLLDGRPLVAVNTGGGGRWRYKRWTESGFLELARRLHTVHGARILLLGGPHEEALNRGLLARLGSFAVDGGSRNPVRRFAALIELCDVLVTGDSLALHIGLALERRIVSLFGPTSVAEIDLYGLGRKISADLACLCCYRETCKEEPNCMQSIDPETVVAAVSEQLEHLASEQQ